MNTKTESGTTILDKALLALAAAVLVGGFVAYYMYPDQSILIRSAIVLGGIVVGMVIALQSHPGKELWHFMQGSRVELRKVIWPNRQETTQTTIAVIIFAIAMGVFFWLLDLVLLTITNAVRGG